jgi:hypothetical protein
MICLDKCLCVTCAPHCFAEPPKPPKPIIAAISGSISSSSSSSDTCAAFCWCRKPSTSETESTDNKQTAFAGRAWHHANKGKLAHCAQCIRQAACCQLPYAPFACPWPAAAFPLPPPLAVAAPPGQILHTCMDVEPYGLQPGAADVHALACQKQVILANPFRVGACEAHHLQLSGLDRGPLASLSKPEACCGPVQHAHATIELLGNAVWQHALTHAANIEAVNPVPIV